VTPEEMRAWVAASRARQGLPPTITDPGVLERCAAAFRVMGSDELAVPHPGKRSRKPPANTRSDPRSSAA
jgi:hypothetical protein